MDGQIVTLIVQIMANWRIQCLGMVFHWKFHKELGLESN